ncbi:MAG: leucine-rich repeat domain-containing protein [Clostridia bacterium]|nr:leucine-rich repeat domain-containing protein [Clostridia bacterium]
MRTSRWFFLLALVCLLSFSLALSEENVLRFGSMTFDPASESIDLEDETVTDWDRFYSFLSSFEHLTHVDMFSTPVRSNRIQEMETRFPGIEFGWTINFREHLVRTDATAFSTLHYDDSPAHPTEEISLLRYCKQLRAVDFGHNSVDDLSFLRELPELRILIFACNRVRDISPLADLEHLEYLEMFTNYVDDLTPLASLTNLIDLNLCLNNAADLTPLKGLTNLERLWISERTRNGEWTYTQAQIQELKDAIPGLEVVMPPNPTAKGWRSHTRYNQMHEIFQTGEYVPFQKPAIVVTVP